jgi:NhaA family Na+:H+ antiporter
MTSHSSRMHSSRARLPGLRHFVSEYLLALPAGVAIALVWSAAAPESYYRMAAAAALPVNEIAMVFFFALVMKETVEATLPGGALHPWRRAALPILAAVAGALATLAVFPVLVRLFGEPMLERGWVSVLAVDLTFGYFVARLIFGRSALVTFFIVAALAANAFAFGAIAATEPARLIRPWPLLGLLSVSLAMAYAGRLRHITNPWFYLGAGALSWTGCYLGGVHPAVAMLPIVALMPTGRRDVGFFVDAPERASDALSRLERVCRIPAELALFGFGLVNAGLSITSLELGVLSIPLAALIGRPFGMLIGAALGRTLGLPLPVNVAGRDLLVIGIISAIGFTMTLFVATAILGPGALLAEIRAGALLSLGTALVAIAAARLLRVGRFAAQ